MRFRLSLLTLTFLLTLISERSFAYPISRGASELRPLIGATAAVSGQPTQFQLGIDWNLSLDGPLGLVLGWWLGFAEEFIGMEVHLGVKYRFLRLHPRVAPFVYGGGGFTAGFPAGDSVRFESREAVTGIGFRFGGGIDFFATPRIIPGMQMVFDLGPRFTPTVRLLGSVQITFGVGFLL